MTPPASRSASAPSVIINEALVIQPCAATKATHFVICNGNRLRYLIAEGGERPLVRSAVSYGGKAALLLKLLSYIPKRVLSWVRLGYPATVDVHPAVRAVIPPGYRWNVLVGTYGEKQKLVFQCFDDEHPECLFVKVGNKATEREMRAEMTFLGKRHDSLRCVELPHLLQATFRSETCPFNIMATREFHGEKVDLRLTPAIVKVWQEIAAEEQTDGDAGHLEFSHGDFAPWNLRRKGEHHIVFDWEHCGMKPHGYDLLYWAVVTRLARCGMKFDEAFEAAMDELRRHHVHPGMNKEQFYQLFSEVITPDGF